MTLLKLIIRKHLGSAGLENTRFLYFHFFPLCFFLLLPYPSLSSPLLPIFPPCPSPLFVCLKLSPEIGPRIKEIWRFSSTNFLADLDKSLLSALCFPIWKRKGWAFALWSCFQLRQPDTATTSGTLSAHDRSRWIFHFLTWWLKSLKKKKII